MTAASFVKTDVTDPASIRAALATPWPSHSSTEADITLFHTAANIRASERDKRLLDLSTKVNVEGTRNMLDAAKEAGNISIFIYTSSSSVGVQNTRFLLWPWERQPKHMVQYMSDSDPINSPRPHAEYTGNYSYSKHLADQLVRDADMDLTSTGRPFRTGALRFVKRVFYSFAC